MELLVRNVNEAYVHGMTLLHNSGVREPSRNGDVLVCPFPVMTVYLQPTERILFHTGRDANPWFHLMEAMWMLLGRDDVKFVSYYNKRMLEYSDDGVHLNGAYGHRWRHMLGIDQLETAVQLLRAEPTTRRAVIEMWGVYDLWSKDVPCNTHIYLRIFNGRLDLTVLCRSNDIIWGAYGANAVHFSVLQEYLAAQLGVPVGRMYQFSNNYHAYVDLFNKKWDSLSLIGMTYSDLHATPIVTDAPTFLDELEETIAVIEDLDYGKIQISNAKNPFMYTLLAMGESWWDYKRGDLKSAIVRANQIPAPEWRIACLQWLYRRN
jgi:hypothetical protein